MFLQYQYTLRVIIKQLNVLLCVCVVVVVVVSKTRDEGC